MYAERLILETDVTGKLKQMPLLPANKQMEAIFLVIDDSGQKMDLATHTRILQVKLRLQAILLMRHLKQIGICWGDCFGYTYLVVVDQ